jgi:hypothetical protein
MGMFFCLWVVAIDATSNQTECYLLVRSFVLMSACLCLLTAYNNPQGVEVGEEKKKHRADRFYRQLHTSLTNSEGTYIYPSTYEFDDFPVKNV